MNEIGPGAMLRWIRRNRVAFTVLAGMTVIALFAVAQSGLAILAGARFASGFRQMATQNLPELNDAARLSELAQSLVVTAPNIAAATSQVQRQTITEQLSGRLDALGLAVERMERSGVADRRLAEARERLGVLAESLRGLDQVVAARLRADDDVRAILARLPSLASRIGRITDESLAPSPDRE